MTTNTVNLATRLTTAWVRNPNTRIEPDDIPRVLSAIHDALDGPGKPAAVTAEPVPPTQYKRAVSPKGSLKMVGRIISMIDGRPYTSLTRHLKKHGLTAAQYRERYRLKPDYPIVAPAYSEARSDMAKKMWHGRMTGLDTSDTS